MKLSKNYLLDLNVLIALIDEEHVHFQRAQGWFASIEDAVWGTCALTEAGLIRYILNPATSFPVEDSTLATGALKRLSSSPGHVFRPITDDWATVTAPIAERIFGHQQVTDAYLLGLAIRHNAILVTFDRGIVHLAGTEFASNVLVLQ